MVRSASRLTRKSRSEPEASRRTMGRSLGPGEGGSFVARSVVARSLNSASTLVGSDSGWTR